MRVEANFTFGPVIVLLFIFSSSGQLVAGLAGAYKLCLTQYTLRLWACCLSTPHEESEDLVISRNLCF